MKEPITTTDAINAIITNNGVQTDNISDGYHTFGELYEHRIALFMALCRAVGYSDTVGLVVWRSVRHSDGSSIEGWFVLGIGEANGNQMTYHLPMKYWDECSWASKREQAPEFDGHTSVDVLKRLKELI